MSEETEFEEWAWTDYMDAREAALMGAAGSFVFGNVPSDRLYYIVHHTTNEVIKLAAQTVLFQRGEK